jgi:cation diffusion facilitator family transporter
MSVFPANRSAPGEITGTGFLTDPVLRTAMLSLLLNITLVAVKLALSAISGSLALQADAVHSLVDVFASIALILGLVISTRKSPAFPYGLYKIENIVSVVISFLLFLTAYEIVREAITVEATSATYSVWLLVVVAALIPVPFLFGRYEVRVGKRHNSPSLIADGSQFTADVLSSSIVFVSLLGAYFAIPLDRVAAAIIAVFIARAGWGILADGMRVLLDASIDQSTLEAIRSIILAQPEVARIKRISGRNSGRYVFVEAEVILRVTDLVHAHRTSERIEGAIKEAVPNVDRVVLHYEPKSPLRVRYAVALEDREGTISRHFGEAPFFALFDVNRESGRVEEIRIVENPHARVEKGKGIVVAEFLLADKPDVVVGRESKGGKGPGYVFAAAGVEVKQTDAPLLNTLVEEILLDVRNEQRMPERSAI